MLNVGVIGYGYWGPNIVRNFNACDRSRVIMVCDSKPDALKRAKKAINGARISMDADDLICNPRVDAVAVVTPVFTHYELAKKALKQGKHVFVEKPFTFSAWQAEELANLAEQKRLKVMVDHTFLYTGAVRKIREIIDDGTLGPIYYFDSMRINLGLFQHDVNVIWDLAPHDLSIMDFLIGEKPVAVLASGESHFNHHEYVAYLTFYFPNRTIAHINVNWLSPVKVRTTLIGGGKKMVVWNDLESDEKIRVYDKGVEITERKGIYDLLVSYRSGDMHVPKVEQTEALKLEIEHFIDCIEEGRPVVNDAVAGWRIVKLLEAANQSLKKGAVVQLS